MIQSKSLIKCLEGRISITLQSDGGRVFNNGKFKNYMKEKGVHYFNTRNETTCSIVEWFNRTLKTKMWKYFTHKNTYNHLAVLPKLVKSYINSIHSSIKMKPKDVTIYNQHIALQALYGNSKRPSGHLRKLKVGDDFRINKMKHVFAKGYQRNLSYEIFTIIKVIPRNPVYKIKDMKVEKLRVYLTLKDYKKCRKVKIAFSKLRKF